MKKKYNKGNRKKVNLKKKGKKKFHLNTSYWMLILFLFALILRLTFLFGFRASSPEFFSTPFLDSKFYVDEALKILNNTFFDEKNPFLLSPLYTVFIALCFKIFGVSFLGIRLVQGVLGSLMVVFVYLTGKRLFSTAIGLVVGFVAALYPPFIYFDSMLLLASLQTTFLILSLYVLLEALDRKSKFLYIVFGLFMGLNAALRPNTLLVYAAVIVFLLLRKREKPIKRVLYAGFSFVGILLIIIPFTIINSVKSGEVIFLSANGGFNFWVGNNIKATGVFITPPGYNLSTDPLGKYLLEKQVGRNLTYSEASSIYFSNTLDDIKKNPSRFILLMWTKARLFFHHSELPQLGMDFNYMKQFSPVTMIPFGFVFVGLFGLFGLICLVIPGWRQNHDTVGILNYYFIAYFFSIILFFVNARYRLPAIPILMIGGAYGLKTIIGFASSRKYRYLSASYGILAVILLFLLTMPHVSLENFSGVLNHEGMALYNAGKLDEAISKYQQAIALDEKPAYIMNLANAFKAKGNYTDALNLYGKAIALEPGDYLHYYNRGNLYCNVTKEYDKAEADYLKSLKLNPRFLEARLNLAVLYFQNMHKIGLSKENCLMIIQQTVSGNPLRDQAEKILSLIHSMNSHE